LGSLTGHRASKTYAYTRGRPLRPSPGHTEFCFAISAPPKLGGCLTLSQSCPLAHWRGRWICGPPIATVRGGRLSANLNVARSGFLLPRKPSQLREVFNATVSSGAATGVPQPSRFHRHWPSCRMIALCYVVMLLLLTTFAAFASVLHSLRSNFAAVLLTVTFVAGSEFWSPPTFLVTRRSLCSHTSRRELGYEERCWSLQFLSIFVGPFVTAVLLVFLAAVLRY